MAFFLLPNIADAAGRKCDLEGLKTYPLQQLLYREAIPVVSAPIFFRDDNLPWDADDADDEAARKIRKDALKRALASLPFETRRIVFLAAIADWTQSGNGLSNFYVLDKGDYLQEVLEALRNERFDRHIKIIEEGVRLFAPRYPSQPFPPTKVRYQRWNGENGIEPWLDAKLKALSKVYWELPDLLEMTADIVKSDPGLRTAYASKLAAAPDDDRLEYLAGGLWQCIDFYGSPQSTDRELAKVPKAYQQLLATHLFEAEMLNGSVHQFFYNSSGGLAPFVAQSFDEMGLPKHAKAVRDGMKQFSEPYPRNTEMRRDYMADKGEAWDNVLYELTGLVDDGEIRPAQIKFAKQAGIFPQ